MRATIYGGAPLSFRGFLNFGGERKTSLPQNLILDQNKTATYHRMKNPVAWVHNTINHAKKKWPVTDYFGSKSPKKRPVSDYFESKKLQEMTCFRLN